jgi:ribosomal protein L37AE/L43A
MGIKDIVLNNTIARILYIFSTVFALLLITWFLNGNFIDQLKEIPSYIWGVFLLLIIGCFVGSLIYKRYKKIELYNSPSIGMGFAGVSSYDLKTICELQYEKVIWKIQYPVVPWESYASDFSPENIEISMPPRCPNCKTELNEIKRFWSGYNWKCISCGFDHKNEEGWYVVEGKVKKIAMRKLEIEMEIKNNSIR